MLSLSARGRNETASCSVILPVNTKPKSPASLDHVSPNAPEILGRASSTLKLLSSNWYLNDPNLSDKSNGRIVLRFTIPPIAPSVVLASGDLITSREEIIAAFTSSKLMPPLPEPEPTVETPLISTLLELVPLI